MTIIPARPQDAMLIGASVVDAIGEEIAANLAGENHTVNDVIDMFATLAAREDSQYSYRNALVAVDDDGTPVGVCVGYDGAKLHELRRPFFETVTENSVIISKEWRMSVSRKSFISIRLPCFLPIEAVG